MKKIFTLAVASLLISGSTLASGTYALAGQILPGYDVPYLHDSKPGYDNKNWMTAIGDHIRLSEFSIPGTHNSLSRFGGDVVATQTLKLAEQLDMGIRYLDFRFKFKGDKLYAYHGPISQKETFDEALEVVFKFLGKNPSETVLIRMQNEAGAETDEEEFYTRFKEVREKYKSKNYIPSSNNPDMGEMRGKFIFIRDFNVGHDRIGIERGSMFIQDAHKMGSNWDLYSKWEKVKQHFKEIKEHTREVSLNYLTGSFGVFPYFVASGKSSHGTHDPQLWTGYSTVDRGIYPDFPRVSCLGSLCAVNFAGTNQLTHEWIKAGKFDPNLGIVVSDFPGAALVDAIIQSNRQQDALVIYNHTNFRGDSLEIRTDTPDITSQVSSYQIPDGWTVRFFEGKNYTGGYYTRETGKDDNAASVLDFTNWIGSIKILTRS